MTDQEPTKLRAGKAASYLGISVSTLAKWRMRGEGPTFHHLGSRVVYYLRHEIDAWLADCDARGRRRRRKGDPK